MTHPPPRRDDFRIAIICALPLEYDAITFAVDEFWPENTGIPGNHRAYKTGRMGGHNVVLMLLPNMGKASAASAAASLRLIYDGIELAVLAGICGGVPSPGTANEVVLGDVIISKSIVQYDLGRQYPGEFASKDTVEDRLGRPSKEIRHLIYTFETRQGRRDLQRRAAEILTEIQQKAADDGEEALYQQPSSKQDLLFEPEYLHRHRDEQQNCGCSESGACSAARNASCQKLECDGRHLVSRKRLMADHQRGDFLSRDLRVFVGRIGSGDTVMKSGADRDRIAATYGLVAFEMEGAGVWDEIPCVVVKAVCDYADSHKNKSWQNYAAATAASVTKVLLEHYNSTRSMSDTLVYNSIRPRSDPSGSPSRQFVVTYNENPDFVGRDGALSLLKRQFGHGRQQTTAKPRSRIALHGLGGVGKTQIALAYVYWLKESRPDLSVFWVHASNAQRFRQAYASIAEACGIPGRDNPDADCLSLVKKWLEKEENGPWLMVVDNADDTNVFFQTQEASQADATAKESKEGVTLGRHIPECRHGSVLITTRNKQTGSRLAPGKPATKVDRLTGDEAYQMLRSMLEESDGTILSAKDASALSSRLEHLPLALAQAAAFIQENEISIRQYVKLLDKSDTSLVKHLSEPFEAVGRDSNTPHALTATWIISFEQIERQSPLASELLSLMSCFDRQAIPSKFINKYYDQKQTRDSAANNADDDTVDTEAAVTKALGTLKAFSFIAETKDQSMDMHRLVQAITQKWLFDKRQATQFAEQALQVVSDAYPYGQHETREVCREYLPHAYAVLHFTSSGSRDENVARSELLHCVSGYLRYLGHWDEAEKRLVQALKLRKRTLGEEDDRTLASMANLALTYQEQGRWQEAERLQASELEICTRMLGEQHTQTLTSMNNLAATYWKRGQLDEAKELEVKILETRKKVLGDEHPKTLTSMNNLAATYRDQGRLQESEDLTLQVIEKRKKVLGETHPRTIASINRLVTLYRDQGRLQEAKEFELRAVEVAKSKAGENTA
ncbi:purine and uridine phosphorylase [Colletotrichum falcatum]|nr:purine and uridine phosphorylase [Colletotrichum falcatum]